ncbi:MAG: carbamoyltransferase HypF [Balneolales bacterium]
MEHLLAARKIHLFGLVQGVGFRPYVYRLAKEHGLNGWVSNTNEGLLIQVEGESKHIDGFLEKLDHHTPIASVIHSMKHQSCPPDYLSDFRIHKSLDLSDQITQISPDIAVCEDCLQDMKTQPHRFDYPFINCTHCGPRFSIVRGLPYDRHRTTMEPFSMCDTCRDEYQSIHDRRFHAQPVACIKCGPSYTMITRHHKIRGTRNIVEKFRELMEQGGIIAMKGLGGFHLVCDALNEEAVGRLRDVKHRDGKPFAVMVRDTKTAGEFAKLSPLEAELLGSWRRPIVLLKQRIVRANVFDSPLSATARFHGTFNKLRKLSFRTHKTESAGNTGFSRSINPGCSTIGMMLPYMPFHHLMFERLNTPAVVMTSGNLSDEPVVIDNRKALELFSGITDAILTYDRQIYNRADDSVVFVASNQPRVIRRARGYVPESVRLTSSVDGILATGAELSHCFGIGKGNEAILSQHIGDLKNPETWHFFRETVTRFQELYRMSPAAVACDYHPDYLSSQFAHQTADQMHIPVIRVQHHHAHVAACMAEYQLNEPVIGVSLDGTGLGDDGHVWGGEFLYVDPVSYKRHSHFSYIPMPGGDKASVETWRMGVSFLYQALGRDFMKLDLPFVHEMRKKPELNLLLTAVDRNLNAPLTSSAGRLFDAVAAITGICYENSFHAEAPIKLESLIDERVKEYYPFAIGKTVSFQPMFRALVADLQRRVSMPVIAARFHNTLVSAVFAVSCSMKQKYHTDKVVLTGGVFQNKFLLEKTEERLKEEFDVYSPSLIPCNDAGIALGQMAIAAHKMDYSNNESCHILSTKP